MNPGLANRDGGRLAEDLAQSDWLLLSNRFDGWNEPNDSVLPGPSEPTAVVAETLTYQLLRKCSSSS